MHTSMRLWKCPLIHTLIHVGIHAEQCMKQAINVFNVNVFIPVTVRAL